MPVIRICKSCGRKNRVPVSHLSDTGGCGACKVQLPPIGEPLELDPALFNELLREARLPVLIDFWAAWCGPCRMAVSEIARAAWVMAEIAIVGKVDTERYPQLAVQFNVCGVPYFIVSNGGRPMIQQAGVANHQQLEARLISVRAPSALNTQTKLRHKTKVVRADRAQSKTQASDLRRITPRTYESLLIS